MEASNPVHGDPSSLITVLPSALGELAQYAIDAKRGSRWPRIRSGEREPIPPLIRLLIFERDGYCCLSCGITVTLKSGNLDHIVPWSAGGPDTSDNLRVLCEPCNADRSNFRTGLDGHAVRRLPVTGLCVTCYPCDDSPEPISAYCGHCGITSKAEPWMVSASFAYATEAAGQPPWRRQKLNRSNPA